jgi:hypothetical protein
MMIRRETVPAAHSVRTPGLRHPLLLLDAVTLERRALSLPTFTPDLRVRAVRLYECVVTCL